VTGGIDYSDLPILPAWYVSGWTAQNFESSTYSLPAPTPNSVFSELPSQLIYSLVSASYNDGNGNQIGGYLTFEQSNDLLIQQPAGTYYRVPARLAGNIPVTNILAYNFEGSGKVYLQWGELNVMLLATDQPAVASMTILEPYSTTQQAGYIAPVSWVYHVLEYIGPTSMAYDVSVPSSSSPGPVDINSLIIANTFEQNDDWNRGY
jgi:hypothetical protein